MALFGRIEFQSEGPGIPKLECIRIVQETIPSLMELYWNEKKKEWEEMRSVSDDRQLSKSLTGFYLE